MAPDQNQYRIRKRRLVRDFAIIAISVAIALYIKNSQIFEILVNFFAGTYFIPATIIIGALFAITFTTAISTSVLIILAQTTNNPFLVALLAGLGSSLANFVIYKYFEKEIISDVEIIEPRYAKRLAHKIIHSKLFLGLVPYAAALLLASPLPDEVGMLLLTSASYKYKHIFLLSFGFHTVGILAIILLASFLT